MAACRDRTDLAGPPTHSQLDHVLVTPAVDVLSARVADATGSDHRPVVVPWRPADAAARARRGRRR